MTEWTNQTTSSTTWTQTNTDHSDAAYFDDNGYSFDADIPFDDNFYEGVATEWSPVNDVSTSWT